MDYTKEFISGFACIPPDYLPEELKSRLTFLSCLSRKKTREIYLAADSETKSKIILKINEPDSPDSAQREHDLLTKLDHTAIPKSHFFCKDEDGREYLLREYIPGNTLDFLLERDGVFSATLTLKIISKLCTILSYLHNQTPPIIYRDIKPQNIIMTPNGKVSLIDFGISKEEDSEKDFDTICIGSTAFAAPEMYGFTKADSRTDIFQLGRLMYYLNTGIFQMPESIGKVQSKDLLHLIKKCTQFAPEKRYRSVEQLKKATHRILYPPTRKEMAIGTVAAVLCVLIGLFLWTRWSEGTTALPDTQPIYAGGQGYEQEVKIPVLIETLYEGQPFSDCTVAIDNHHWFQPAQNGKAELYAFAYDEYKIRAVMGNRTAFVLSPVTKDTQPLAFTFDLAQTPHAPEYLPLVLSYKDAHEINLELSLADSVTLFDSPNGISVEKRGDNFYLLISADVETSGHHLIFAEATNAVGKADMVLSINLTEEKAVTIISTAEELDKVRENLAGSYALGADIDLSGFESWTPIGTPESPFTGDFYGAGYTITNFRIQGKESLSHNDSGLFGVLSHGTIRNVVVRSSSLHTAFLGGAGHGFIVGRNLGGLVENCAVFDSSLTADIGLESGAGGICGINQGVIKSCLNAADVTSQTISNESTDSSVGGICGVNQGYLLGCGNSGNITGISLAGGVAGFNDMGVLTKSYNSGYIKAPAYFSSFLPGGISHLLGRGKLISYCAFENGSAQVGASVFNGGTLLGIVPIDREDFRDMDLLSSIFHSSPEETGFIFASVDSYYPIPIGIFTEKIEPPVLPKKGLEIALEATTGVQYFYTVDGSDPLLADLKGEDSVKITLEAGQTIQVFAAKSGRVDSETVEYQAIK